MANLVEELLRSCIDEEDLSRILLKAKVVAHKLDIRDILDWVNSELKGYPGGMEHFKNVPDYRWASGRLETADQWTSWRPMVSDSMHNAKQLQGISRLPLVEGVAQLEHLVRDNETSTLELYYPELMKQAIVGNEPVRLRLIISTASVMGMLAKIRDQVLEWALELDKNGILGDGMSFTDQDKQKAANVSRGLTIIGTKRYSKEFQTQ